MAKKTLDYEDLVTNGPSLSLKEAWRQYLKDPLGTVAGVVMPESVWERSAEKGVMPRQTPWEFLQTALTAGGTALGGLGAGLGAEAGLATGSPLIGLAVDVLTPDPGDVPKVAGKVAKALPDLEAAEELLTRLPRTVGSEWGLRKWAGWVEAKAEALNDLVAGGITPNQYKKVTGELEEKVSKELEGLEWYRGEKLAKVGKEEARRASEVTSEVVEVLEKQWHESFAKTPLGELATEIAEKEKLPFHLVSKEAVEGLASYASGTGRITYQPHENVGILADAIRHEQGHYLIDLLGKGMKSPDPALAERSSNALMSLLEAGETQAKTGGFRRPGTGPWISERMMQGAPEYQATRQLGEAIEETPRLPHRTFGPTGRPLTLPFEEATADIIEMLGTVRGRAEISPLELVSIEDLLQYGPR